MRRFFFALIALCTLSYSGPATAQTFTSNVPLSGYAWSDNVGWIHFDAPGNPVVIQPSGNITGYAWSDNIGWIKFGSLGTSPQGGSSDARINLGTGALTGWARACAGAVNSNCTGAAHPESGGWDGWIKLSDTTAPAYSVSATTGTMQGYSWGSSAVTGSTASSSVIGWIEWDPNYGGVTYVPPCSAPLQCLDTTNYEIINEWCQVVGTGSCAASEVCFSGGCLTDNATGTISVNPLAVRPGGQTQVSWSAPDATSCTVVQRAPGGNVIRSWSGLTGAALIGSGTSNPVTNVTVFGLRCTSLADPALEQEIASTTLRIIPTLIET